MLSWFKRMARLVRWSGWLAKLEDRLRTQDGYATAWPLYVVQEQERVYGLDWQFADDGSPYVWMSKHNYECQHETDADLCADYPDESWHDLARLSVVSVESKGGHRWDKIFYVPRWRFVCAHLTEDAANAYIRANSHNLTHPRVYVTSQHRCYEWQDLMRILGAPHA